MKYIIIFLVLYTYYHIHGCLYYGIGLYLASRNGRNGKQFFKSLN